MTKFFISVIIPVHNRARILPAAIRSVLGQGYDDFELIIVDDGSQDNVRDVVESFNDTRIIYLRHDQNRGVSAARNTGIKHAKGELIAFLDSDDVWRSGKLLKQLQVFNDYPDTDCVYSVIRRKDKYGTYFMPFSRVNGYIYDKVLMWHCVPIQSLLLRRSCFDSVGFFDERLLVCEDWDMCLRLSKSFRFRFVPVVLVESCVTDDSISTDMVKAEKSLDILLLKRADDFKNKKALSAFYCYAGHLFCANGRFDYGKKWLFMSFYFDFLNFKKIVTVLSTIAGENFYKIVLCLRHKLIFCYFNLLVVFLGYVRMIKYKICVML